MICSICIFPLFHLVRAWLLPRECAFPMPH